MHLRLALAIALVVALLAAPAARAGFAPGGAVPGGCAGDFVDRVGTQGPDTLITSVAIGDPAERLYGLDGADRMEGGPGQGSCLFGGRGTDYMTLGAGGGVLLGEDGADVLLGGEQAEGLLGGPGPDAISGGAGTDVLRGDSGIDGFNGGPGDDVLLTRDGRRELVLCGGGNDLAKADGFDVLFGCERRRASGRALPARRMAGSGIGPRAVLDLNFVAPTAGETGKYVMVAARCPGSPPRTVATLPAPGARVRTGQRVAVSLRAPRGGWCRGAREIVLNRRPACAPGRCLVVAPLEPLARLRFRVR